jgi:hypothetical protein
MSSASLRDPASQPFCCAHECSADLLLRAEGLLFRLSLRARAHGAWEHALLDAPPSEACVELLQPCQGWLGLRCPPELEAGLAGGHSGGLLDLLLRRLSGDCIEAGGRAWRWREGQPPADAIEEERLLRLGRAALELRHWR